ncbi:Ectopic P granules protein 5 [Actinomortierella ambigua]|uniref:Ectopic P granules protein 5 n=1 Tax=Actinomortierella ambigua TaxID=1343610 RepID=A0A9P6U0N3_9FUNG|nr:Ectopic P granules protein 5 [Actinomortierella ambigua]
MGDATTPTSAQEQQNLALPPLPPTFLQYTFQPSAPLEQASAPPLYPHAPASVPGQEPSVPRWGDAGEQYLYHHHHPDATSPITPSLPFSTPSAPPLYPALHDTISPSPYPSLERDLTTPSPIYHAPDAAAALPAFSYVLPVRSGLSKKELRDLFIPPSDTTQALSAFERRSKMAVHHSDLYDYMNAYERASASIQQTKVALFQLQQKAKGYAGKLWTVQTKTEVVQATCADGATISHSYSYQVGNFEPDMAAKLKKSLLRLKVKKARLLVRQQFEETTCRLWIEDKLSAMLNGASWAAKDQQRETLDPTIVRKDLETVKAYLDVLFYFERTVRRQPDFDDEQHGNLEGTDQKVVGDDKAVDGDNDAANTSATDEKSLPPNTVMQSIRRWITMLVAVVLEYGDYDDRIYLLMHVFRSRHAASWSATFLQCAVPKHWSDPFLDFYLLQYALVLCGPSSSATKEEGVTLLWGHNFDEDDYLAIIDQLDIPVFFQRLVDHYCSSSSSNSGKIHQGYVERRCLRVLAICHSLFDWTITGLERRLQYPVMAKRLVQTLCQLCQILGDHLMVLRTPSEGPLSLQSAMTPVQTEVDSLFLRVLRSIIALPAHGLWNFLPSIPFQFMSHHAIATLIEDTALEGIEGWIMNPLKLLEANPESNRLRTLLGRNPSEGVFFLTALASMAQSKIQSRGPKVEEVVMQEQILGYRIAEIITFLLVDAAFLDSDIRSELSKPTREILATLCDSATDLISLLLRVVDRHFEEIGTMALYLFKELPLDDWNIGEQEFAILTKLLEHPPLGSPESLFARHVLGCLDWGNTRRFEESSLSGQKNGHVPLYLHKELALAMADICIVYMSRTVATASPSTESTKPTASSPPTSSNSAKGMDPPTLPIPATSPTPDHRFLSSFTSAIPQAVANLAANSGIHASSEQSAWKAYMGWAWSMLSKLKLIDVPVLSLRQASRLHFQDAGGFFSKLPLLNQGQPAFIRAIHLMLTEASREPSSFALEGWATLSSVLQADQGAALIDMLCDILPMLISAPKEEAEQHCVKFSSMLQEIANHKPDPMLSLSGQAVAEDVGLFPIESVPVDLLGIWVMMRCSLDFVESIGTSDRLYPTPPPQPDDPRSKKKALQFWMSCIFSQKDWMMHPELSQVMDLVCLVADGLGLEEFVKDQLLEQQILLSIGYRRSPGVSGELMGIAQPKLDRVMDLLPERLSRALPVPQGSNDPSLLVGNWSVKTFATTLLTQQPMVESKSFWFAYQVLKVETHLEREMRVKVGLHYEQHPEDLGVHGNIKTIVKKLGITTRKTIFNFSIWRWAQHLLVLPMSHTLQPLYWYMFFNLYFSHTDKDHVFYGHKFLESSASVLEGESVVSQLKEQLRKLYGHFRHEAKKCIQAKQVDRAESLTHLHDLYVAMFGWLSEPLLLTSEIDTRRIRKDLLPDRLASCRLTDQQESNANAWRTLLVPQILTLEVAREMTASKRKSEQKSPPLLSSSPQTRRPGLFAKAIGHVGGQVGSSSPRPSPRSSPRMQRQQSFPRHDQKIGTCLVKQAKPGPAFFLPRHVVMIPSLLDHRTNPRGLFREIVQTLKDCAKAYQNTLVTYENMDKSYLDELQSLYYNETRTKRLDIACDSTPNTLCKKPAVFNLRYEEILANDKVRRLIVDNRARSRELSLGSVDTGLCLAALEMAKIIEAMLDYIVPSHGEKDQRSEKDISALDDETRNRLHQVAIESFYFILGGLLKDAENGYPPAQLILERTVDALGKKVVALDAAQTEPILNLMGTSSFSIALLHQIFNPANQPKDFVRYYQRIATCKEYELSSKDLLLQQFDVFAWACPESTSSSSTAEEDTITVMDRLAFYEVAFTAMMAQQQQEQQDKEISERELRTMDRLAIIKSHRELAGTLLLNFLGQDYINYLRILLDTCAITCLEPEVIQDYIRILGVDPRLVLSLLDGSHVHYQPGEMQATVDASSSSGPQLSTIEKRQQQLQSRKGQADRTLERQEAARKGMTRIGLSDYDLGCLVRFLVEYFTQCQEDMALGNLLDRYTGYVIYIADLIAIVLCDERFLTHWMDQSARAASLAIHNNAQQSQLYDAQSQCPLWRDTFQVFRPWLSCLTEHAVDEIRFQRQQGGASRMLFTFVGIVNKAIESIYRHFQDPLWCETSLFTTYLDIVQGTIGSQGTANQVMLIHQHFRRLDWRNLEWSQDMVVRMLSIQSKLDVEIRAEFWTYLVTAVMDKVQTKIWGSSGHNSQVIQAGPFELSLLHLGLCILQDVDRVAREDPELETLFLHRLWSVILGYYPWHERLATGQLAEQVELLPIQWNLATSLMDLEKPLGVLLYWLRITTGLETGQDLLESDVMGEWHLQQQSHQDHSGESGYGGEVSLQHTSTDMLQPERVLLYFQYLLNLVLVRLSSSASDEHNVNFSLEALPSVIVHLCQVLDLISGNRTETRHSCITAPLTSLLGLVNHSYKTRYYRTLEVVLEGFRSMLSQGADVVHVIQLDIVRACCQSLTSIPLMVFLLEQAMEREFDLWDDWYAQTGKLFVHPSTPSGGIVIGSASMTSASQQTSSLGSMGRTDLAMMSSVLPIIAASSPFMSSDQDTMDPGTGAWDVGSPTLSSSHSFSHGLHSHAPLQLQHQHQYQYQHQQQGYESPERGRHSWKRICQQLEAPEMAEQEFIEQCLEQGALLTLHAWFLQRRQRCGSHFEFDTTLELGQELALIIARVDLSGGPLASGRSRRGHEQQQQQQQEAGGEVGGESSGGLLSWVAWRSSSFYGSSGKQNQIGPDDGQARKTYQVLLLLEMYLFFVSKEAVHNIKQSRFLDSLILICETLEGWFQDRDSSIRKFFPGYSLWTSLTGQESPTSTNPSGSGGGDVNKPGMPRDRQRSHTSSGSTSTSIIQPLPLRIELDTKFKLVTRILYTYIASRLQDKGIPLHRVQARTAGTSGGWRRTSLQPQTGGGGAGRDRQAQSSTPKSGMDLVETLTSLPSKSKEYGAIIIADEGHGGGGAGAGGSSITTGSNSPPATAATAMNTATRHLVGQPIPPPRPSSENSTGRGNQHQYHHHQRQHRQSAGLAESQHLHSASESSLLSLALGKTSLEYSSISSSGSVGGGNRHSISSSWDESAMDYVKLRPPSWIALGHNASGPIWSSSASASATAAAVSAKKQQQQQQQQQRRQRGGGHGRDGLVNEGPPVFVLRTDPQQQQQQQQSSKKRMIMVAAGSSAGYSSANGGRRHWAPWVSQRDFDWAVGQIQDRRMRVLEAHEFLKELMMRFYPDEARFAV